MSIDKIHVYGHYCQDLENMAVEKKFIPEIKVYAPVDLSKNWFVFWKNEDGKRVRKYGTINQASTFPERTKRANQLKEYYLGNYSSEQKIIDKLYAYLDKKKPFWEPKTYQSHKSKVNSLKLFLKGKPITNQTIQDFFYFLIQNRHPTTHNNYREKFNNFFEQVGENQIMNGINKVSATSTPAAYFQKSQINLLRANIKHLNPQLWFFCQFICNAFIRPKELRLMKVSDILLEEMKILVRAEVSKNDKRQFVPIIPNFQKTVLQKLENRQPDEWLFPGVYDESQPIGVNTMSRRHREILKKLRFGTEHKLYSWKHTGAVLAVKSGIKLKALQLMLRHHSLEETDKYLRQLGIFDFMDDVDKFGGV